MRKTSFGEVQAKEEASKIERATRFSRRGGAEVQSFGFASRRSVSKTQTKTFGTRTPNGFLFAFSVRPPRATAGIASLPLLRLKKTNSSAARSFFVFRSGSSVEI
jgi:hypothetical protein